MRTPQIPRKTLALALLLCGCGATLDAGGVDPGAGSAPDGGTPAISDSTVTVDLLRPDTLPPCASGTTACGATCCGAEEICLAGACTPLGPACDELQPCAQGSACDSQLGRCVPGATRCEYHPPTGDFNPSTEWSWTGSSVEPSHNQVMMTPMVANLTDDNGDGKINRDDIPDIVFSTFKGSNYLSDGILRVVSGDGKKEHFSITNPAHRTVPGSEVALGDLDGDGVPEIVACASGGGVIAFEHDGTFKWTNAKILCGAPALADLDADGEVEVVSGCNVLAGRTGVARWQGTVECTGYSAVADLDEDGRSEVIGGRVVYSADGKIVWQDAKAAEGYVAVADLDGDGRAEVVTASASDHSLRAHHADGKLYFGPVDINQGHADLTDKCQGCGGGPPTVADFDGDGRPEIAAAAGYGYVIFEHDGTPKWFKTTQDLSSRCTGSSVFDFEGDGHAEVVYGDELVLRVYNGVSGDTVFSLCNTSGTLREYPIIVDVDNDGHAEMVVANNNYAFKTCADGSASSSGIRVIGDAKNNWVRTRRIWNQHTYHVTNVDEDGRIPKAEARNWDNPALNNFRQNVQPGGLFDAPDLSGQAASTPVCSSRVVVKVEVKNQGAAKVMPGLAVTLYARGPDGKVYALTTEKTKTTIFPGQSETLAFSAPVPAALVEKTIGLYAMLDDDGAGRGRENECDEQNNRVDLSAQLKCFGVDQR